MSDPVDKAPSLDRQLSERILLPIKDMIPGEIHAHYDDLVDWIDATVASHAEQVRLRDFAFPRLSAYYPDAIFDTTSVIVVDECPEIPLRTFGFERDDMPSAASAAGFTLRDCYFVTPTSRDDESTHFHELVHVVQWRLLGEECFLHLYGAGLLMAGYRGSPLEMIAYGLQSRFDAKEQGFDVVEEVRAALAKLRF